MNELVKITERNGTKVVSARELHSKLEVTERFGNWIKRQFQYGFIEGSDYIGCEEFNTLANQQLTDYALTVDAAKEISMLQRTELGKMIRRYLIESEKKLIAITKTPTTLDFLKLTLQAIEEQSKRVDAIESKVLAIESKTVSQNDYVTVIGYAIRNKKFLPRQMAIKIGKKASAYCRNNDIPIDKISDPKHGYVNLYSPEVLEKIFAEPI